MYKRVKQFIMENHMLEGRDFVVAGFSGGADSVCLLLMMKKFIEEQNRDKNLKTELAAVHVHHGIRGVEADRDAAFCREFCSIHEIEYREFHYDVPMIAKEQHLSEEEAGRLLRHQAFNAVSDEYEAQGRKTIIAVAHHKNDQAETVLFNLVRGTGVKGAMAMRPARDHRIRPLLCLTRQEIEQYLKMQEQSYCTDSTNLTNEYTRNRIRNHVIDYLQKNVNTGSVQNLSRFADRMAQVNDYIEQQTSQALGQYTCLEKQGLMIYDTLQKEHPVIVSSLLYRLLEMLGGYKDLEEKHVRYLTSLFAMQNGRQINLPSGLIARRTYGGIFLYSGETLEEQPEEDEIILLENLSDVEKTLENPVCWHNMEFEISIKTAEEVFHELGMNPKRDKKIPEDYCTKYFDYDKICKYLVSSEKKETFYLRSRKQGDYIEIDCFGHRKKIKEFFIEQKIPEQLRDEIPLFVLGSNVLWITGKRGSSAFWLDESTSRVLVLHKIR